MNITTYISFDSKVMTKTMYFNNGEPQIVKSDGKMQTIIVSDEDKVCGPCWDCFWAPCFDAMGSKCVVGHIRRIMIMLSFSGCTTHTLFFFVLISRCHTLLVCQNVASQSVKRRSRRFLRGGKDSGIFSLFLLWLSTVTIKSSTSSTRWHTLTMKPSFFLEERTVKHRSPSLPDRYLLACSLRPKCEEPQRLKWMQ